MNYSPEQRFALCLKMAREIVKAYRSKVPDGIDPQNTWVAIAGTAISAGTAIYTANQQKDALDSGAFGGVPEAALYEPVDFDAEQLASILGNTKNFGAISDLTRLTNNFVTDDAMIRAKRLIPGYKANMKQMGANTTDLLAGRLPFEDVMGIISDQAGETGSLGIPGTSGPATLKDLGISRLSAMEKGSGMLQDMVRTAETISPRSSYASPQDQFVSPLDRIKLTMEQNALIQQSQQNANNLAAGVNPSAVAQAQGVGQVDYGSIAQQLLALFGGRGGGASTGGLGANMNLAGEAQYRANAVPKAYI